MRISIRVDGGTIGDVEIEMEEPHLVFDLNDQRSVVARLLERASRKVRLACEIEVSA